MPQHFPNPADLFNASDISKLLWSALPPELSGGLFLLITIGKVIGILVIIYLAFLIIQSLIRIRSAQRVKSIEHNVEEINKNIKLIIEKLEGKKKEEKKEEKKK